MPAGPEVSAEVINTLPEKLREAQGLFDATGGLHAAALFDSKGELLALREDVGRHNATDKLVGWALLEGRLPLSDHIVLVSAVDVAREFGMTLVGFLRGGRFNVYAGSDRIRLEDRY
jgi:FdhD protein